MFTFPKLIALDLDGTLLTSQKRITQRSELAIREMTARGVTTILCTGRAPRNTRFFIDQLNFTEAVVSNGSAFYDFSRELAKHVQILSTTTARQVVCTMRETFPGIQAGLETTGGWYLDRELFYFRRPFLEASGQIGPSGVGLIEDFLEGDALKLFFRHPDRSAQDLSLGLLDFCVYKTWGANALLEVMNPRVNKRNALSRLASRLGIAREEVAAFGDGHNDREMLIWAGTGVAMANSAPEIFAVADVLTTSNDEEGVAKVLEKWLSKP